jgi:xanthine dehydrogenase YagS FAD-binding subunit
MNMNPISYLRAEEPTAAVRQVAGNARAKFLAGGTSLLDLMKLGVEAPASLVDINNLPLSQIEVRRSGVRIGALVTNTDLAYHHVIRNRYPVLSQAILSGASPQLRNMATVAGNLMQRTRCTYFRDGVSPCNKRVPGAGCAALDGFNRSHAVLGTSDKCIASNPSDMCVALAILDAVIHVTGEKGARTIPFNDFHLLPSDTPERETVLEHGELITAIELPSRTFAARSHYLKVQNRATYEFALASAAVALEVQDGIIRTARLALGGIATKPWRAVAAEQTLVGTRPAAAAYSVAAQEALKDAKGRRFNTFKIELARRIIVRALTIVGEMS